MTRPLRIDFPGSLHHVMNRGANRQRVFFGDIDRVEFERLLGDIFERFGVSIIAYCLMDNHYHLIVSSRDGNLSAAMQRLGSVYTRHTNDRIGRDGALFRGRFRSILIDSESYFMYAVRYVDLNSLDLPGVRTARDHRWGSHRMYLGLRRQPDFLDTSHVLSAFGSVEAYARFVSGGEPLPYHTEVDVATIRSLVELAIVEHMHDDVSPRAAQWMYRLVMHLVAAELGGTLADGIFVDLGFASVGARKRAHYRAIARRESDAPIDRIVEEIARIVRSAPRLA
jgi:putative transposase